MGDSRAHSVLNFWPLVVALVCLGIARPIWAGEAHEGNMPVREEAFGDPEAFGPETAGESVQDSGGIVGNLPRSKKPPDYNLKNLKPEDYPLEFLIPFMKTSQVFQKKVKAKAAPSLTSRMDHEMDVGAKAKPIPRKWTALPPAPERAVRTIASSETAEGATEEVKPAESNNGSHSLVSVRPQNKPTRQLLDSFKASQ